MCESEGARSAGRQNLGKTATTSTQHLPTGILTTKKKRKKISWRGRSAWVGLQEGVTKGEVASGCSVSAKRDNAGQEQGAESRTVAAKVSRIREKKAVLQIGKEERGRRRPSPHATNRAGPKKGR